MNDSQELLLDITVLRPEGKLEHLVIPHARVLVGTGAHCDIRIEGVGAAREHLELELQGETLLARARSYSPPPLVRGTPLVAGVLESGSQVAVCGTRLTVRVVRENQPRKNSPSRKLASFAIAMAALMFPVAVFAALRAPSDAEIGPPPKFTSLWEAPVTTCRFEADDLALHHAKQARSAAEASRERYPFAIEEGVAAVAAFEMASACHRAAGRNAEAARDEEGANSLRTVVERDYHAHRVRLEHDIETDDVRAALIEVRTLRSLTNGRKGPYFEWLGIVERRLDLSLRAEKKKEAT